MSFLREIFLQSLPANVCMILTSVDSTTDLWKVAKMSDKILEVAALTATATLSTELPSTPPPYPHLLHHSLMFYNYVRKLLA